MQTHQSMSLDGQSALDILVNNAGVQRWKPLLGVTEAEGTWSSTRI